MMTRAGVVCRWPPPQAMDRGESAQVATEEGQGPRPGVAGRLLVVAVRAVAHEAVSGLGVDDGVGVGGFDALDLGRWYVGVLAAEEEEGRAERLTQLVGDAAAVEGDRSCEPLGVQGGGPRETPAHAEAGDPDPPGTEAPERVGRGAYVPEHLLGL